MSVPNSVRSIAAAGLLSVFATGCAVSGFARDVGTGESDTYDDFRMGSARAGRAQASSVLRPDWYTWTGGVWLPGAALDLEVRAGPSLAMVDGAVVEARATANHDISFTPSRDDDFTLVAKVDREYAVAHPADSEATFEWTAVVKEASSGTVLMQLDQPTDHLVVSVLQPPMAPIDSPRAVRKGTAPLKGGVKYILSIRGFAYAKTEKRAVPAGIETANEGGFFWPYANAEVLVEVWVKPGKPL